MSLAPEKPIQEIHEIGRSHYGVKYTNTFLASYSNESWIGKVKNFGEFLSLQKEKKRSPTIYLLYPYPYSRLLMEKEEDNSLNKAKLNLCNVCYNEYTNFCLECAVAEERQEIENQGNPTNRDEATLAPLSSSSSELPYSNSFCNFDSPIENNISNTLPALSNSPSLPSTRSFVAQNGNANIESTRSRSPLTRIRERPLRYRHSIGSPNLSTYHRPIIIAEDSLSTQSQPAQLVDTVPTHFQLPITTSHVSPQSVRTEPQIVNVQIVPTNQGDPMSNMPSEERYLQLLQETNAPSITDSTHVQVTPQYQVPGSKMPEEDASLTNAFGTDEIERFFCDNPQVVEEGIDSTVNLIGESQILLDLNDAFLEYKRTNKKLKHVIVQRDSSLFWAVLFRQNFDLTQHDIVVRFAGEAGADVGGPLREFLVLCIRKLPLLGQLVFGEPTSLAFQLSSEGIMQKQFYKLGQLSGYSILLLGRGPVCFHPVVVRALFRQEQPLLLEEIEDGFIKNNLSEIRIGNFDCLMDLNINSYGKTQEELLSLYLLSSIVHTKYHAINQFAEGVRSVHPKLLEDNSYNLVSKYFQHDKCRKMTFDQVISLFQYKQVVENILDVGSNERMNINNCITEFELFLLQTGSDSISLGGNDILDYEQLIFFATATDRIPPYGFEKLIDVTFEDVSLPKVSTCALTLTLPNKHKLIREKLVTAVKHGGGFGEI